MMSVPGELTTVEAKSQKRKKRRKIERGNAGDDWAKSLSECQLDLLVSIKQLAMERVRSTKGSSFNELLTPAGLRAIGVILEEFMMDRVQTLRDATAAPSLVIDDLRACIQKLDDEPTISTRKSSKHMNCLSSMLITLENIGFKVYSVLCYFFPKKKRLWKRSYYPRQLQAIEELSQGN